jgi:hypothetical protein
VGRKRRVIIIETERTIFISHRPGGANFWCDLCGMPVPALTVEEAAAVARTTPDEIFRKIDERRLHCLHAGGSRLRICPNSLLQ